MRNIHENSILLLPIPYEISFICEPIEKDFVISLLPIVLDNNRAPHLSLFLDFLTNHCTARKYSMITPDQWNSFLTFCEQVNLDLVGYEEENAWPTLLEEYVEWRRASKATTTA